MKVVVDLGCAAHSGEESLQPLIDHFHPDVLYGFDPHPAVMASAAGIINPGQTIIEQKAAWVYDGEIGYTPQGLRSRLREQGHAVPCFDFARWLRDTFTDEDEIIVKMDIEGAENEVLKAMIASGADERVSLLLIEWHDHRDFVPSYDRQQLLDGLRCPVGIWHEDV